MINSVPNNKKYHQGLFIPINKDKVIKLNSLGGLYYRSSLEKKIMIWLDSNTSILRWSAESLSIPYKKTEYNEVTKNLETTTHTYYPDFYYELQRSDGSISRVVAEVKPSSETVEPILPQNATSKKLKNFNYNLIMWNKNLSKWKYMIEYCERKGFEFIIITEKHLSKG